LDACQSPLSQNGKQPADTDEATHVAFRVIGSSDLQAPQRIVFISGYLFLCESSDVHSLSSDDKLKGSKCIHSKFIESYFISFINL
jgi:hypothetical protein